MSRDAIRLTSYPISSLPLGCTSSERKKIYKDIKEKAKLFGRLSDKYILLDSSGGSCCYSGCTDCEFRDDSGGYKMSEMSAARPKWIVPYSRRTFGSTEGIKDHAASWSRIFGDDGRGKVTVDDFAESLRSLEYKQPLGGPYLSVPDGSDISDGALEALWNEVSGGKKKVGVKDMERVVETWAGGEGVMWNKFAEVGV